jgi:hypothetical protein
MSAFGGKADISDGRSETVYLPEKWNLRSLVLVVGLLIGSWFEAPHANGWVHPRKTHPLPPEFFETNPQGATMNQSKMSQIYQGKD